ncbi:MAG: hypothetical protein KIT31_29430 [Deltaproteobacteria bacterium]|nr:hypothetical protein [Deltaproteobacteria bacterium]
MRTSRCLVLAHLALVVACGGPTDPPAPGDITLTLTSPSIGAELSDATISVTGSVATTNPEVGALEVWVNGARTAIGGDGAFSVALTPALGINHIDVEAGDGFGAYVVQELDVLWVPAYLPPVAGTAGFDLADALELRLGQRFFDPRPFDTSLDLTTDPVVAHDLAAALELIVRHIDLAKLLDGNIQVGGGTASLNIVIPSARPDKIVVDARIVDGDAIALDIDLLGVFLATTGTFRFGNRNLAIAGGIAADMHASTRLGIARAADGTIDVTVSNTAARVGPLVPQFTGPNGSELDAFITLGGNDFRRLVEDLIVAELVPAFTNQVPPLLESLLGAAGGVLDDVRFELEALGTPVAVTLDGASAAVAVVPGPASGHVTIAHDVTLRTTTPAGAPLVPVHGTSRGAPRVDANPARPLAATSLGLDVRHDLLNALLHALWNGGLLDGAASFGGLSAGVAAKLPPVVVPTPPESSCKIDGERCDILLQLGQLEVSLADFEQSFGVSAVAGARIVIRGNTVSFKIQTVPQLRVWEITTVEGGRLTSEAIRDVIATVVWPRLFGAIGENLSITLPIPDLAALGLGDLAPGLMDANLELVMRQRPSVANGYLGLGADLQLATPPPP